MKAALIESGGDLFVASQLLKITALRLDRAVGLSELLQTTLASLRENKRTGLSMEALQADIDRRMAVYRVVGLDALHDLAAMPIDINSAQNQVKLAAAARLAGGLEGGASGGEMGEALRELNQLYQANAPRLRVIREKTTIELSPAERVVGDSDGRGST